MSLYPIPSFPIPPPPPQFFFFKCLLITTSQRALYHPSRPPYDYLSGAGASDCSHTACMGTEHLYVHGPPNTYILAPSAPVLTRCIASITYRLVNPQISCGLEKQACRPGKRRTTARRPPPPPPQKKRKKKKRERKNKTRRRGEVGFIVAAWGWYG